ncbi:MAG: hypothetical protein WAJ92_09385 [Candidatus Acidiferrales bacterium]
MKALLIDELRRWFDESPSGIKVDPTGHLRYPTRNLLGLRLDVPAEAQKAAAFASSLLSVEEDDGFYGALVWFTNWDIGTPQIERCGLRMLEQMRRGYGVTASVENAPAQLFRTDEIADVQAFLTLPMLFGWDAYFAPHGTRYFAYVRQNGSLFLVTDREQVLHKLQASLDAYRPASGLPSYLESAPAL